MVSIIGALTGFFLHDVFGAQKEGEEVWGMFKFPVVNKSECAHIHHWVVYLVLLGCIVSSGRTDPPFRFAGGFCVGGG